MSSPQIENGYTKIANELFEIFISKAKLLSPYEITIWLCILRKTYGYEKKIDYLSLSQISKMTNILQTQHISRTLSKLKLKNMIHHSGIKGKIFILGIQKNYELWKLLPKQVIPKQVIPKQDETITQTGQALLPKQDRFASNTINKHLTKENIQKKVELFDFEFIWEQYPKPIGKKAALRHFLTSVKTQQDYDNIQIALKNYIKSETVSKGFIQNGSTWFNNWTDWTTYPEIKPKEKIYG